MMLCISLCCIFLQKNVAQTIVCYDYDLPCTHPDALNEFYGGFQETAFLQEQLPYTLQDGVNELHFAMPCGIIQDINIHLQMTHENADQLEVGILIHNQNPQTNGLPVAMLLGLIHPTSCMANSPLDIDVTFDTDAEESFDSACSTTATLTGTFQPFGNFDNLKEQSAGYFADEWILRIVNMGGTGIIESARIDLELGFSTPYQIDSTQVMAVELINEQVVETSCEEDGIGARIERIWQAVLDENETTTCKQVVNLLVPPMDEVVFLQDFTVNCDNILDVHPPNLIATANIGCHNITEEHHGLCDISYTYKDTGYSSEVGSSFVREWTVVNWCTSEIRQIEQHINVECQAFSIQGTIVALEHIVPEDVSVHLEGYHEESATLNDSTFRFHIVPDQGAYTIRPETEAAAYLSGISTYDLVVMSRHILGIEDIASPYKLIAADVNQDGFVSTMDIVLTRQLILAQVVAFPDNKSWRFIPLDFEFQNPANPLETPIPESITLDDLSMDYEDINFIVVPLGDVD